MRRRGTGLGGLRGCPRVPGGPPGRSGGIAFEGGTGRWQTSGPTGATSVAGLGQRQCRREIRPRRHRLATEEQNNTRPSSAERVLAQLEGLPYF
jgi:hypothetical protein